MNKEKLLIIGAGLSGLYTACLLQEQYDIQILEARPSAYSHMDALPLREHPHYGFDAAHFNERFIFSGTESAFKEGGYLEGAVNASKAAALKVMQA